MLINTPQGRNRMTDKGALALSEALQVNSSLHELELVSKLIIFCMFAGHNEDIIGWKSKAGRAVP